MCQGYNDARIQLTRELVAGGVSLAFTVFEGRPTRVAAVSVTGSSGLPLSELLATLGLRVGGVLDRGGLDAGLERLRTLLRERGYWRASVGQLQLQGEGEAATVVVPISAGPRFSIHFHGNHRFPATLLARMLTYDGSEPLDTPTVARLARRLESFYRYRGFHDVRVEPREVHRPDGEEAVLAFDIEEGHPLRVGGSSSRATSSSPTRNCARCSPSAFAPTSPIPPPRRAWRTWWRWGLASAAWGLPSGCTTRPPSSSRRPTGTRRS